MFNAGFCRLPEPETDVLCYCCMQLLQRNILLAQLGTAILTWQHTSNAGFCSRGLGSVQLLYAAAAAQHILAVTRHCRPTWQHMCDAGLCRLPVPDTDVLCNCRMQLLQRSIFLP